MLSSTGEPLAVNRWAMVGKPHILGTIGSSADWQLTFRDGRVANASANAAVEGSENAPEDAGVEGSELAEFVHFDRAAVADPDRVFLNVFDLAPSLQLPNQVLCNTMFSTIGAFHAAVEVFGEEWSFYRTQTQTSCGVCKSVRCRNHPVHVYRQSVDLGKTDLKPWEVQYLIRAKLAVKWPGGTYDLLTHNCIHFCDELLLCLGVSPVPPWVRGLHETGNAVFSIPWPLSTLFSWVGNAEGTEQLEDTGNGDGQDAEDPTAENRRSEMRSVASDGGLRRLSSTRST